jgi:alpha-L-fucosidase
MVRDDHQECQARRVEWFRDARFGMFVHWGLYSLLGRHEWVMNLERIPVAEYEQLADQWHPKTDCIRRWAKMARQAGMRYVVLTAKHHEGFCLWDSGLTDYNAVVKGPRRDLIAEYVEAARAEGLRVGIYYSLMDWHHQDGLICARDEEARKRFVAYTHGLVRELCSNYGKIDILWYDLGWPLDAAGWESEELNRMVRELQPDILINDRSHLPEDFDTPEQHIKPTLDGRAWEVCMTFSEMCWGYTPTDTRCKTALDVLKALRDVASKGGNLLLNVGPTPEGEVQQEIVQALGIVSGWLKRNGAAIYTATDPMHSDIQLAGEFTRNGNIAYLHVTRWPGEVLVLGGFKTRVQCVCLSDGTDVQFEQTGDRLAMRDLPILAPDDPVTVIEIECEGEPVFLHGPGMHIYNYDNIWASVTPGQDDLADTPTLLGCRHR